MNSSEKKLTPNELKTLTRLAKKALWTDLDARKALQEKKVNLVPCNFYSEIPSLSEIANSFEHKQGTEPIYDDGLFQKESMRNCIDNLLEYAEEFNPPIEGNLDEPQGFFWKNPAFSYLDAMAYYCVLRYLKPERVLEIGSGYSTLVADAALKANKNGSIISVEPYPKPFLKKLTTVERLIEKPVQEVGLEHLVSLIEDAKVWFIDSTHTVKAGSDCLYIYLKLMPLISSPTWVHAHDIYLPFGIPKNQMIEKHIYWTEQYLLYAYLLDNPKVELRFGSVYARRFLKTKSKKLMKERYPVGGASLWFSLNEASAKNPS